MEDQRERSKEAASEEQATLRSRRSSMTARGRSFLDTGVSIVPDETLSNPPSSFALQQSSVPNDIPLNPLDQQYLLLQNPLQGGLQSPYAYLPGTAPMLPMLYPTLPVIQEPPLALASDLRLYPHLSYNHLVNQASILSLRNSQRALQSSYISADAALGAGVASLPRQDEEQQLEEEAHEEEENDLPPGKKPPKFKREGWEVMFERLLQFKQSHGHCVVPQDFIEDQKLGNWVQKQRALKKTDRLLPYRSKRLDEVGFVWRVQETWDHMYDCLVKYKEEHGNCNVPKRYKKNPKLGKWIRVQRMRRNSLPEDRLKRLKAIGFERTEEEKTNGDK